jgi:P-type conjugative transfer ATPase TrbB
MFRDAGAARRRGYEAFQSRAYGGALMAGPVRLSSREEQARRIAAMIERLLGDYCDVLSEEGVVELMLNTDRRVWLDRLGRSKEPIGTMEVERAEQLIAVVASTAGTIINRANPVLECRLMIRGNRYRFSGRLDITDSPVFNIRKHASAVFTLADYVRDEIMTEGQRRAIEDAIKTRQNMLVTGGPGSGKTTLLNAILGHTALVCPQHRWVICEDTPELAVPTGVNAVPMATSDHRTMLKLVADALRMAADRIIVGETRTGEIVDFLIACNTGNPGSMSTVHANSARDALTRAEAMAMDRTQRDIRALIAAAINVVIHIDKLTDPPGRRLEEIVAVTGFKDGAYQFKPLGE